MNRGLVGQRQTLRDVEASDLEKPTAIIAHSPNDKYNSFCNWSWVEPSLIYGINVRAGTRIAIEEYGEPILITVGEREALRAAGRNPEVHYFPDAGHVFGGDDEHRRRAHVLRFLRELP